MRVCGESRVGGSEEPLVQCGLSQGTQVRARRRRSSGRGDPGHLDPAASAGLVPATLGQNLQRLSGFSLGRRDGALKRVGRGLNETVGTGRRAGSAETRAKMLSNPWPSLVGEVQTFKAFPNLLEAPKHPKSSPFLSPAKL